MTYVFGLVALLVLLAGVIAYAGDRLGTWVGRRRLTLFGWRPRRTGQIVGVAVGILIMLTTIGVLALAFRNAAQTLVNAQRTADELVGLRNQERFLQTQLGELRGSLATLQEDLADAQLVIGEAEAARDQALADRDALLEEAEATRLELETSRQAVATAQADLAAVEAQLVQAEVDRVQAEAETDAARAETDAARAETEAARAEAEAAMSDAEAARMEIVDLESQLGTVEASLLAADVRMLQLDVQLSEASAALAAADLLRRESEEAAELAEQARQAAEAATLAAAADRDAAIAQREAAQAQLDALEARTQELGAQLAALAAEITGLEAESERLVAQAANLEQENVGLQARNDQLTQGNQELVGRNESLQELNVSLQAQILSGNETVRQLQGQVEVLRDALDDQARRLTEMQQEFSRVASGEITFERDQVVYSGALYATDVNAARDELAAFVRQASAHTARLGAGEVALSADQFNFLVEVIAETEGSDLVRLISPRNQFNPVRVEVTVEAFENTRLYETGQLLFSRPVHVGNSELPVREDELRGWITQLKGEAIRFLRRAGLDELQAPVFVGLSDESFANQLLRMTGQVVVGVMARDAIDRAGPAEVELIILY